MKKISILFLPEHLDKTFNSVGIDKSQLDLLSSHIEMTKPYYDKNYETTLREESKIIRSDLDLKNFFNNKVSNQDITDFIVTNVFLFKKLFKNYRSETGVVSDLLYSGITDYDKVDGKYKDFQDIMSMYVNNDIIINENNLNQVFSIIRKDNCIFVILKNGFSNLLTLNREDLQKSFINLIFDQMIKTYEEQSFLETGLLVSYLRTL